MSLILFIIPGNDFGNDALDLYVELMANQGAQNSKVAGDIFLILIILLNWAEVGGGCWNISPSALF